MAESEVNSEKAERKQARSRLSTKMLAHAGSLELAPAKVENRRPLTIFGKQVPGVSEQQSNDFPKSPYHQ
jgi:hypothetical protein